MTKELEEFKKVAFKVIDSEIEKQKKFIQARIGFNELIDKLNRFNPYADFNQYKKRRWAKMK